MRPISLASLSLVLCAACGDNLPPGPAGSTDTPSPVTIGGSLTGLEGAGLVLTSNGVDELAVTGNGAFAFPTTRVRGATYAVAVKHQPSGPTQVCSVTNGTGAAGDTDVTNVQVSCRTTAFAVGGTVTGLAGAGLVLQANGDDNLSVNADGTFAFPTPILSGATYEVTVAMQPSLPTQACTVATGTGTVGGANVVTIDVRCATVRFTLGGTVTGLLGTGLVLRANGGDDLAIGADGRFTFATPIASGAAFAVTVLTQPATLSQTCTASGGTGTVGGGHVTSIAINCTTNRYTVGGTISGLVGTVTLQNEGGDELDVTANGTFAFATPVPSGATYGVTVKTQPTLPWQTCTVSAGAATVTSADVANVAVTCTTNVFTIGGTLSGLAAGNAITLRNNGGGDLVRSANGSFTFPAPVASGQPYAVTVVNPTSPISQTCTVTSGAGLVIGSDVTDIQVTCTTNTFTIGGTVSRLTGTGFVLRDNGGDDLAIASNGTFTFPTPVASGATYSITIRTQPTGQTCTVTSGTGTMGASNVTSVEVTCVLFPIVVPGSNFGVGALALDNNGDLLVAVANPARAIVRVNHLTGVQTTVATGITVNTLFGIAYRAANDMIYATTDNSGQIFAVTPAGTVTLLTTVGTWINAITIAPPSFGSFGGFLICATLSGSVIAVNPADGALTTITSAAGAASDLAFAPDGTLYISGGATVRTVTAAGVVTPFASGFTSVNGITITPDGARMFVTDSGTDTVRQVTIPGAVVTAFAPALLFDYPGPVIVGILAAPGNTLIVMTGQGSLTLRAFPY
jgi:hypothetical protein